MSTMYITEFADVGKMGGVVAVAAIPATAKQNITFTGTAGQSAAFQSNTRLVRVHVDGIASILFGTNPTATANVDARMTAGQTEYFDVSTVMSQGYKISAVTST